MKKAIAIIASLLLAVVCFGADNGSSLGTWDLMGVHDFQGNLVHVKGVTHPAWLRGVKVKPGTRYRLHYTAGSQDQATVFFENLQINTEPRVDGLFLIQDIRKGAVPAFQNFSVPAGAKYETIDISFEVKSKGSIMLNDLWLEEVPEVPYEDWALEMVNPFYRNTIYASDENKHITAKFTGAEATEYTASLSDEYKAIQEWSGAVENGEVVLDFDASALPYGEYVLVLKAVGPKGERSFRKKISIVLHNKIEVKMMPNKYFTFNGKPFYPVFWFFEMVEEKYLYEAARNGVTCCIMGFNSPGYMKPELDRFHKYGIKGVMYLEQKLHIRKANGFKGFQEKLREFVTPEILNHPALLGYLLSDEPFWGGIPVERVRQYYEEVKKYDPYRPVWINAAPRNEIPDHRPYAECADLYGCDIYPVPYPSSHSNLEDRSPSCVGEYTKRFNEIVCGKKPIWMVLQGNSWSDYGPAPAQIYPHPTYDEERFMTFDAITHGSHGYGLYLPEANRSWKFQQTIFAVAREVHQLSGLLIYGQQLPDALTSNPAIRCALYEHDGHIFGIAMNKTNEPQADVKIELPVAATVQTIPAGEPLDLNKLQFKQYESIVFGSGELPPPVWELPQISEEFEGKETFKNWMIRKNDERRKAYEKANMQIPAGAIEVIE